jgi:hypothetical protein
VVAGAFQIVFHAEMHANDVFLFFKNHFWHQHIKTIQKIQTALHFSKKKIQICTKHRYKHSTKRSLSDWLDHWVICHGHLAHYISSDHRATCDLTIPRFWQLETQWTRQIFKTRKISHAAIFPLPTILFQVCRRSRSLVGIVF